MKENTFRPAPSYWETSGSTKPTDNVSLINHFNSRAILHDESVYKDPETFNPERFLKNGQLDPDVRSSEFVAFGFGRRYSSSCGRRLCTNSRFVFL
jgi:hypothetical protein